MNDPLPALKVCFPLYIFFFEKSKVYKNTIAELVKTKNKLTFWR